MFFRCGTINPIEQSAELSQEIQSVIFPVERQIVSCLRRVIGTHNLCFSDIEGAHRPVSTNSSQAQSMESIPPTSFNGAKTHCPTAVCIAIETALGLVVTGQ